MARFRLEVSHDDEELTMDELKDLVTQFIVDAELEGADIKSLHIL